MDIATLGIKVDSKGVLHATRNLDKLEKQGVKSAISLRRVGGAFLAFGAVTGIQKAIAKTAEFGQSIANLSAITGATGKDLKFYAEQAKQIGITTSLSATQAANAFKLIASAKPDLLASADALAAVTKQAVILAEATGEDLTSSAAALGSALNQFNLPATEAAKVINILAASSKFGTSAVAGVTEAMKNVGPVASALGIDFAETTAAIQGFAKAGIVGADAGTKLRSVMLKLEKSGDQALMPSVVGISAALENLGAKNLEVSELMGIFGEEAAGAAAALVGQAKTVRDLNVSIRDTSTALDQQKIRNDTFNKDLEKLGSAIEGLSIELFGESIEGLGRSMVQTTTGGVQLLTDGISEISDAVVYSTQLAATLALTYGVHVTASFVAASATGVTFGGVVVGLTAVLRTGAIAVYAFTAALGTIHVVLAAAAAAFILYQHLNKEVAATNHKNTFTLDKMREAVAKLSTAREKAAKVLKDALALQEKLNPEYVKTIALLKIEQEQLKMTSTEIRVANTLRELTTITIQGQKEEIGALIVAIEDERAALELSGQEAEKAQQKLQEMSDSMGDSFKATFREMLDGGDNVFRNLVDSAKAMVKDILSEMALLAAKPFIMRIAGVATMGSAGMANAASGSSGGDLGGMDLMSNFSSLSSLSGNSFGKGAEAIGNYMATGSVESAAYQSGGQLAGASSISNLVYTGAALVAGLIGQKLFGGYGGVGASIGTTIGLMVSGGNPIGGFVGGTIGGAIGGAIGPDKPSQRFAISTGSNVGGHTGNLPMDEAIAKFGNQSDPDGSNFASTSTAFGKTFLNSRRVDLTAMKNMIESVDTALASFLSGDEIAAVTKTLDSAEHFASGKHSGNKEGTQFAAIFNRYRMVLASIDEELVSLFDARANQANIGTLPVGLAAINKDLKDQLGIFNTTLGTDSPNALGSTLKEAVEAVATYSQENEDLLATYTRLSVEAHSFTSSLATMGISLNKSVHQMISFAAEITKSAGDADTASALWASYFKTFYTDQERAIASLEEGTAKLNTFLKATELDGLGLSMQNFRASFEQALSAGLSASQTVDWLAAGELIRQVEELANTGMTGKISTLVTAKNDLIDAYKREIESQEGLASSFRGLADGLRASAQGLLLSSLSPLTNAERFAAAEARFNSVNSRAQLGDADALADLASVSEEFLKESQKFNASGTAYTDDFNMVQTALTEAGIASNRIADNADRMVDQLKAEFNLIATSNHWLETINTSVLSLEQALDKFVLEGGNGTAAGKANGSQSVAMSNAQFVDQLYTQGFGRQADIGGANYWNESLRNGATRQQIVDNFVSSAEAANVGFDQTNIKMFAKGGISNRPAIFGEAGPEAAVPLPDGRSIPVTLDKSIEQAIERMAIRVVAAVQGTTQAVNDSSNDAQSSANRVQAVR